MMALGVILAAAGLALAPVRPALAQPAGGDEAYTVSGVAVDVSSANPATARDQAIAQAQRKAWDSLYQRMAPAGGAAPRLSDTDLARMVQGFDIEDEKIAPGRYVASYTVRFRPQAVRDALGNSGVASIVEQPTRPFVLLPVTTIGGRPILWEDRTPWREAWEAHSPGSSFVPLLVPDGELDDVAAIGVAEALTGDSAALGKIAQRHKAGGVIVVRTDLPATGADPKAGLTVEVTRYMPDGSRDQRPVTVAGSATEAPEDFLARAVAATATAIDQGWKQENTTPAGPERTIAVSVPLVGLTDWVEARKRLSGIGAVSGVEVQTLGRTAATVSLGYRGDLEKLRQTLSGHGLFLTEAPPRPPVMAVPGQPPVPPAPVWELRLSAPMGAGGAVAAPLPSGGPVPLGAAPRDLGTLPATQRGPGGY